MDAEYSGDIETKAPSPSLTGFFLKGSKQIERDDTWPLVDGGEQDLVWPYSRDDNCPCSRVVDTIAFAKNNNNNSK